MQENKYDNPIFFEEYRNMPRSIGGLSAAGEWPWFEPMLPELGGLRVLDLGCGFGWHCRYVVERGAEMAVGVDISEKMLDQARNMTDTENIQYVLSPIEDVDYPAGSFDLVISSLAFHYLETIEPVYEKVFSMLSAGGSFVFSVEHPVFTAQGIQDWHYGADGKVLHWPVDNYFYEGLRNTVFLGEPVIKYHRTMTTYVGGLLEMGFEIVGICEPGAKISGIELPEEMSKEMADELRRPMMLLISARKK